MCASVAMAPAGYRLACASLRAAECCVSCAAGGKNANLAAGEDPEMFRTLVGSCGSLEEGDDLVETLVRG